MSRAGDIYWDSRPSGQIRRPRPAAAKRQKAEAPVAVRRDIPWWLSLVIATVMFAMLGVALNYRVFSSLNIEAEENTRLANQIQNLMDENLALQEEIHSLKTDPKVIEMEAKKLGLDLRPEKVPVPAN